MQIEFYPNEKLKKEILEIVKKHLDTHLWRVFFFGSRVRGDNFPRSDIDIGIKGPKPISAKIKLDIEEELENLPTLYKFDFVDFKNVSEKFKKEALKNVEYVK
jgi:predicted nucleotidyltransferase